jgi:hypothetical protein
MASQSRHTKTGVILRSGEFSGSIPLKVAAECPDLRIRVCRVGPADTWFSCPANVKIGGKSIRGFVTCGEDSVYRFIPYTNQEG